jgi:3-methyladenine DNA glycosylase AlkD
VYTQDFRRLVREYKRRLAGHDGESVYQLGVALLDQNVWECRNFAYEIIAGHAAARGLLNRSRIEALGRGIDNWASVDAFSCTLVGTAWRAGRISDATIKRWACSKDLWWRRAAVVATVPLNVRARGGHGDTQRTIAICELLVADPEPMVQKAVSWALRALVAWDRKAVSGFLAHALQVPARVRREVETKLRTGKKQ